MSFARVRDGKVYYILIGCAITSLYFLLINSASQTTVVEYDYGNISRNYQYEEVCSEWKKALQVEKQNTTVNKTEKIIYTWSENDDLNSRFVCDDSPKHKHLSQRSNYYVIYNFVQAEKEFGCTESITLTAPGDYRFLDNVVPLIDRWQGPVSIALYAPGHDFYTTIRSIAYLRQCQRPIIKKLVSFHVFFDTEHMPDRTENEIPLIDSYEDYYDCSLPPPWETEKDEQMYKTQNNLLYPINVARNVAKLAAKTYFVFPSDIELYPTKKFIPLFLKFVKENLSYFSENSKNVFVLPIFEVLANQSVPENKTALLKMLQKKTAIVFHQTVCLVCHRVIDGEKWVRTPESTGLGVFSTGKREGRYMVWEPFYVCTQKEPLWDERFSWEGQGNKMVQAFTMCVMDYDFHVLDNAFLIHKPGVKKKKVQIEKFKTTVAKATKLIKRVAIEIQEIYGYRNTCKTNYIPMTKAKAPISTNPEKGQLDSVKKGLQG